MRHPEADIEKVVIIGSGPAGWTAAIYAARASLQPLVFPGRAAGTLLPGGQLMLTTEVENYPGFPSGVEGPHMMQEFAKQALRFGTRVVTDDGPRGAADLDPDQPLLNSFQNVESVDLAHRPFTVRGDGGYTVQAHSVIIATGATANWLGLPNEMRLAQIGGGVSACAVCDGALPGFRNQPLAVVGGGDTAMEEASYLTKFASKVYIIHRRAEFRASKVMQQRLLSNPKAEVIWDTVVTDVLGDQRIEGLRLKNVKSGAESTLPVRGLFAAIGHTPATRFLDPAQVQLDEKGYVLMPVPHRSMTSVEGVFVAGDCADAVYRQAVTAAGMGCKAAIDAERWLADRGVH
jgi:thioredoxin reductase (NADPH)